MRRAEYLKWNKLERLFKKRQSWNLLFSLDNPASEPLALISCPASRAGQTTLNTTFHPVRAMMDAFVFIAVLTRAAKYWWKKIIDEECVCGQEYVIEPAIFPHKSC
jgi:hypothetical protein